MRMIDAETVKLRIGELALNNMNMISSRAFVRIMGVIDACETVGTDRRGRWIELNPDFGILECSVCNERTIEPRLWNGDKLPHDKYCRYCGAKMDGE